MNLPAEIIFAIWNNLSNIDVLYAFTGVNRRFNHLVRDDTLTRSLVLLSDDSEQFPRPLPSPILDRFCVEVLPAIHDRVQSLTLEPISMERILSAGSYPRLHQLTLKNVDADVARRYFADDSPFTEPFCHQITHLIVTIRNTGRTEARVDLTETLMVPLASLFLNLTELDINSSGYRQSFTRLSSANLPAKTCFTSALVRLRIRVETFDDCLYLLDGRLPQLHQLDVQITEMISSKLPPNSEVLTTLKILSFSSYCKIQEFNSDLIPFFSRLKYLEELKLHLWMRTRTVYIDGTRLNEDILIHMPRLRKLALHIDTWSFRKYYTEPIPQMIDGTQKVFHNGRHYELIRYYDHHLCGRGRCHVYSIPYGLTDFQAITNRFPGGSFPLVRYAGLLDMYLPFEHEFFLRISQSFPFLTYLRVINDHPPENKWLDQQDVSKRNSSPVEFKHLADLDLDASATEYLEYFLMDVNVHMPCLTKLVATFGQLISATQLYTREATRRNCSTIEHIVLDTSPEHSPLFYEYFPQCK